VSGQDYHVARERRRAEEADYARTMGEYLARIFEAEDKRKAEKGDPILDAINRSRLVAELEDK
jgi:glycerol-3-phosphate cytidylyltransferase-like family protein